MRAGLAFFLGAWAGWIGAAAVSVFLLGQLVRPYNASASFGMLASASILPSLLIGVGAWLGAGRFAAPLRILVAPAAGMAGLCALLFFAPDAVTVAPVVGMAVAWVGLPALAWYWSRRLAVQMPRFESPGRP
jgi:hypothetical protein